MSSSGKVKPGPAYVPLRNESEDVPKPAQQPQPVTFVQTPSQPMMVMYTAGGLPLGPTPTVQFVPTPVPCVVRPPQTTVTPNTHLVLTFVMFVILTVLAPETLVFMIPALVLAILSNNAVTRGQYGKAKKLGHGALALNFIGLIAAFVVAIVCVSLSISLYPWHRSYDDYYYGYYGGCYYPEYDYDWEEGSGGMIVERPMVCY